MPRVRWEERLCVSCEFVTKFAVYGFFAEHSRHLTANQSPYVTFEPRPKQMRPDLQFWRGTTIMIVGASGAPKPRAATTKNPDEVYDLKWLNNDALIFDRVADDVFYQHARIWKVAVPR
jgi:hypothetical protein